MLGNAGERGAELDQCHQIGIVLVTLAGHRQRLGQCHQCDPMPIHASLLPVVTSLRLGRDGAQVVQTSPHRFLIGSLAVMRVPRPHEGQQRQPGGTGRRSRRIGTRLLAVATLTIAWIQVQVERPTAVIALMRRQVGQRGFDRLLAFLGRTVELAKLSSAFRRAPLKTAAAGESNGRGAAQEYGVQNRLLGVESPLPMGEEVRPSRVAALPQSQP